MTLYEVFAILGIAALSFSICTFLLIALHYLKGYDRKPVTHVLREAYASAVVLILICGVIWYTANIGHIHISWMFYWVVGNYIATTQAIARMRKGR